MNERMIELYKQAQEFAYKNISEEYWNTDNFHAIVSGKFAELFIKECSVALNPMLRDMISRGQAVDLIKQHFEQQTGWICPKCGVDRTKDVCPKGHTAAITGDCPMIAIAHTE
jgi:hypothetical protein